MLLQGCYYARALCGAERSCCHGAKPRHGSHGDASVDRRTPAEHQARPTHDRGPQRPWAPRLLVTSLAAPPPVTVTADTTGAPLWRCVLSQRYVSCRGAWLVDPQRTLCHNSAVLDNYLCHNKPSCFLA